MLINHRLGLAHSTNGRPAVEPAPQVLDQTSHSGSIDSQYGSCDPATSPLFKQRPAPDRVNHTSVLDFYLSGKNFF
jgi:hypothetical protein